MQEAPSELFSADGEEEEEMEEEQQPLKKSLLPTLPIGTVYEGDLPTASPGADEAAPAPSAVQDTATARKKREERKLAIMTMSKKRRRLFDQIMKSRNKKRKEVSELKRKREVYEAAEGDSGPHIQKRVRVN